MTGWLGLVDACTHELTLFAAVGLIVGGLDDLLVDLLWLGAVSLRAFRGQVREELRAPRVPGRIVVFVPAWDEGAVIGAMLRAALARFAHDDYRIYVGTYPNDPVTQDIVAAIGAEDGRVRLVSGLLPGPTTKAECLNRCWAAAVADAAADGVGVKAVVLHDAEDLVHPLELRLFDAAVETHDLVQLPVLPLIRGGNRWISWRRMISATYADEFAEAHGKGLVVRELVGAGMPSAGVGTGLSAHAMRCLVESGGGAPFDASSVTEDYELGLKLRDCGARGTFARVHAPDGGLIAVRAYFPDTLDTAVWQKARWLTGIALAGWDRLGWRGGPAEAWMRLRDRRAPLAALVLLAAYAGAVLGLVTTALRFAIGLPFAAPAPDLLPLLAATGWLLGWRGVMRVLMVARVYGLAEGFRALPRLFVSNLVAVLAARRALGRYIHYRRTAVLEWDKTAHVFPDEVPAG